MRTWLKEHELEGDIAVLTEGPSAKHPETNHRMEIIDLKLSKKESRRFMSQGIYIAGGEPRSGKSVIVLGVMEMIAGQRGKSRFFPPRGPGRKDAGLISPTSSSGDTDWTIPYDKMLAAATRLPATC